MISLAEHDPAGAAQPRRALARAIRCQVTNRGGGRPKWEKAPKTLMPSALDVSQRLGNRGKFLATFCRLALRDVGMNHLGRIDHAIELGLVDEAQLERGLLQ